MSTDAVTNQRVELLRKRAGQPHGSKADHTAFCHVVPIAILVDIVKSKPAMSEAAFEEILAWSCRDGNDGNGRMQDADCNKDHSSYERSIRDTIANSADNEITAREKQRMESMFNRLDEAALKGHLGDEALTAIIHHLAKATDSKLVSALVSYLDKMDGRTLTKSFRKAAKQAQIAFLEKQLGKLTLEASAKAATAEQAAKQARNASNIAAPAHGSTGTVRMWSGGSFTDHCGGGANGTTPGSNNSSSYDSWSYRPPWQGQGQGLGGHPNFYASHESIRTYSYASRSYEPRAQPQQPPSFHYTVSDHPMGPMKKDGTPDMRFSANRK